MIALSFETQISEEIARSALSQISGDKMAEWLILPFAPTGEGSEIAQIKAAAKKIQKSSEYLVCIGIGGSYLGHRAVIEALQTTSEDKKTKVVYAGNALSQRALDKALKQIEGHDFSVNVISKSGTTIEPARAFAVFKEKLIEKYGEKEARTRIYATTDAKNGKLHAEAEREGYTAFVVPDGAGGRYSVLSAVGLLPLAVAGVDIDALLAGARDFATASFENITAYAENITACAENVVACAESAKPLTFAPDASAVMSSENREEIREKAQFQPPNPTSHNYAYSPAGSVPEEIDFSGTERSGARDGKEADLGDRDTIVGSEKVTASSQKITAGAEDWRSLQFKNLAKNPAVQYAFMRQDLLKKGYDTEVFASFEPDLLYFHEWLKQLFGESEGKNRQGIFPASVIYSTDLHSLGQFMQDGRRNLFETILDFPTDELNAKLVKAVQKAHLVGGIPVLKIAPAAFDARGMGELIYFFELSCALSATLSGVNPFDQPGVETYKAELKRLIAEAT